MEKNIRIIFNEPVTTEQVEQLSDWIIAWLETKGLTALVIAGEEGEEESGDVQENM